LETDLDAELSDFRKHWDNSEQPCSDKDSESLTSEDEDLEEEAVEQSELEKFSAILKEAQKTALNIQRTEGIM
jgi:hypothetical protein